MDLINFGPIRMIIVKMMKVKFLVMAMMIVGAMCGCTAQESNEKGCDVFKTERGTVVKMYCTSTVASGCRWARSGFMSIQ